MIDVKVDLEPKANEEKYPNIETVLIPSRLANKPTRFDRVHYSSQFSEEDFKPCGIYLVEE